MSGWSVAGFLTIAATELERKQLTRKLVVGSMIPYDKLFLGKT
ncbi:MAG: hypothetical protein OXC93_13450 [Rhodospirillaceae bacterium]|nr:hypothetical protein [Rhodospirillaceae bacterium]